MINPIEIPLFIKRTYKLFSILICVVVFFSLYNIYLVDHSLINLRIALDKATLQAKTTSDFDRIKTLLKVPILKEMAKTTAPTKDLTYLELAENVAQAPKSLEQISDIKYYLQALIKAKEKERGKFLSALDKFNSGVFGAKTVLSQKELQAEEKRLLAKVSGTTKKELLQKVYYDLGNVYIQMSDLSKAEAAFFKAIEVMPASELAVRAKFNLAWAYKTMGEYEKAMANFQALSQEYAGTKLALLNEYEVADTLYKKGDYIGAREKYLQLSKEDPDTPDLGLFQAGSISYYDLGDKEAALEHFSELEEKFLKTLTAEHIKKETRKIMSASLREQGFELLKQKKYQEAIENFRQALEIYPLDTRSIIGIGLAFYWLKDKEQAVEKTRQATDVSLEDDATVIDALFIYINCGELDAAIELGEKVRAHRNISRSEFYYNLGYAYVLKSEFDKASLNFGQSISANPDFVFAYNNLGCSLWSNQRYEDAISKFREAISRESGYADAYFNLGVAYFYMKRLEDAQEEFKKVLFFNPEYAEVKRYLDAIVEALKYEP